MSGRRLLRRASLRHLTGHRLQLLLSVLGVALGVAVVLAIDLAIQSSRTGFLLSSEAVSGRATHAVTDVSGTLDESLLARIRIDAHVPASAPIVQGYATSPERPGRTLTILGIDPFSEGPFRPYVAGAPGGLDVGRLVSTRRGVALSAPVAESAGLAVGDTLTLFVEGTRWTAPLVGVVTPASELARSGLADIVVMDVAGAQEVLRMTGSLSRIDLRVADGPEGVERLAAVRALLPPGVEVEPVGVRAATMSGMIEAFDVNLTALSLLALVFGMFLIFNAMTFSVVQRRELLGRLRAIGVTRGEVVRMIVAEATAIGVVGAVLGCLIGVVLARGLVGMVSQTINDLYFAVSVRSVDVEPWLVAKAALLGVAATILASLPPTLEAAGADPRASSLRSIVESRARALVPRAAAAGVVLGTAGGVLLLIPTRSLGVSFPALFLVITGLSLMTPGGALVLVALLRPVVGRVGGSVGLMAVRGVGSGMSRTGPAIAALAVAVSVTVGLGVMIASFRGTLAQWLDGTLRADVYVSLPGPGASRAAGTLWPDVIDGFVAHPDVVGHSTYRGIDIVRGGDAFRLVALDLDARGEGAFSFLSGRSESIMADFRVGSGVIVSEPFAYRRGLDVGDTVELATDRGPASVTIVGVFYDYGSEQGTLIMARRMYDAFFDDRGVTSLALFLADGVDSERVVDELVATVPEGRSVIARTNDTLRSASLEVFDRTFRVTAVLRLLAFMVAFVGVLSALAALELERARELGLLRAMGLTPGQLRGLVVAQTGLLGLAAGVLAIPTGLALSIVMIYVVNKRSFGWTLTMEVGPEVLAQAIGLALVAALLAGLYPAWRMARTSPALALRGE